jgi:heat-inducible transcriptional repressor
MPELTERRRMILRVVVQEYVEGARPVGSETIAAKYQLGVSPATVRNELAVLEQLGLIHQLHTSAGRVPSEEGYRYYVEHLMEEPPLSTEEQRTIEHQFHQVQLELNEWMRLTVSIMARVAQAAALVTAPRAFQSRLKHVELISIHDTLALLVAVFDGGNLQQQMFVPPLRAGASERPYTQDELRVASVRLNQAVVGLTTTGVEARLRDAVELPELDQQVYGYLLKMMRTMDEQLNGPVQYDGLSNILNQPEFSTMVATRDGRQRQLERVVDIIQLVQEGTLLEGMLPQLAAAEGVQVIIGGEGRREELHQYSIVLSRYGGSDELSGLLGIFGPTRMQYGRSIAIVRYMTRLMSTLAREMYGTGG